MKALLTFVFSMAVSSLVAQCLYDQNGDGYVGIDGELLEYMANHGLDNAPTDHNANGLTDVLDILEYARNVGQFCPESDYPTSSGRVQGLVLAQHHVHTTAISDPTLTIPAGHITYRLYLEVTDETDILHGVYGIQDQPLEMTSSTGFLASPFVGNGLATDISPAILSILSAFPSTIWSSWLTLDRAVAPDMNTNDMFSIGNLGPNGLGSFGTGENVLENNPEGAMWFQLTPVVQFEDPEPSSPTLRLLAQFTVAPESELSGTMNVQIVTYVDDSIITFEDAEALSFSSDNITVVGCTNPDAENYMPAAAIDDGSCTFFGDIDGDGIVGTSDVLEIIGNIGCTTCDDLDFDGDGIVDIGDLLTLLGVFGTGE